MSSLAACNGVRNDWWREWRGECNKEKGEINDADICLARFKYRITRPIHFFISPDTTVASCLLRTEFSNAKPIQHIWIDLLTHLYRHTNG